MVQHLTFEVLQQVLLLVLLQLSLSLLLHAFPSHQLQLILLLL